MPTMMENSQSFCRDPLIDINVMWNTTNPNVTACMRDTILSTVQLPVLLSLGLCRIILSLASRTSLSFTSSNDYQCKLTKLFWSRLFLLSVLLVNAIYNVIIISTNVQHKGKELINKTPQKLTRII